MILVKIAAAILAVLLLAASIFYFYFGKPRQQPEGPPQPHKVTLTWNSVKGATSYGIYRRPYRNSAFVKLGVVKAITYEDPSVQSSQRYCYQVTSVDSKARESAPSPEVCITVPRP